MHPILSVATRATVILSAIVFLFTFSACGKADHSAKDSGSTARLESSLFSADASIALEAEPTTTAESTDAVQSAVTMLTEAPLPDSDFYLDRYKALRITDVFYEGTPPYGMTDIELTLGDYFNHEHFADAEWIYRDTADGKDHVVECMIRLSAGKSMMKLSLYEWNDYLYHEAAGWAVYGNGTMGGYWISLSEDEMQAVVTAWLTYHGFLPTS